MRSMQAKIDKLKSEFVNTKAIKNEITALKAKLTNVSEKRYFISGKHNDLV